ncbi:MAG TPA: hypothetical protein VHV47_01435 [Opitutaceae bacterium]|jgi:hypothetical protein|nr:hypothetical protein [Opitutaceae bacterium]
MKAPLLPSRVRWAVLLALAWPAPARAVFGVGDVVYDPANTTQTINLLRQAQQEFDRLGSLLGVSTKQLDQLLALAAAVGNPAEAVAFAQAATPSELQALVRTVPGLGDADLTALFNPQGWLDAFLGLPVAQWDEAVGRPNAAAAGLWSGAALERSGTAAPANYAQWYAGRTPEDQYNLARRAAADFSDLLAGAWLQQSRERRVRLEALAAAAGSDRGRAGQAKTSADQQRAQAQLSARANDILLQASVEAAETGEAQVRAAQTQTELLREASESRRNAEEMALDAPP